MTNHDLQDTDFEDILDHWQSKESGRYRWEGERGVENFDTLVQDMGYRRGIDEFLSDNPGAIEALLVWVGDHADNDGIEWKESLAESCGYEEESDEEESDEEES
jgi:hypothetical protein